MPELPEVETTCRGISPFLLDQTIDHVIVRNSKLRVPVPVHIDDLCKNKKISDISRRGKYLIIQLSEGFLLIHLGMSGHLKIVDKQTVIAKHDHIDLCLINGTILRYHDPRRFGLWLYSEETIDKHSLLTHLGPEPLLGNFNGEYLCQRAQGKKQCIKSFIMNNHVVVGVGNIYATESLFHAGIHPETAAGDIPTEKLIHLSNHIKEVLQLAIHAGGTTLRDFYGSDGKPGYFTNKLHVYGRQKLPCHTCMTVIESIKIAGRNSSFCPQCQPAL